MDKLGYVLYGLFFGIILSVPLFFVGTIIYLIAQAIG